MEDGFSDSSRLAAGPRDDCFDVLALGPRYNYARTQTELGYLSAFFSLLTRAFLSSRLERIIVREPSVDVFVPFQSRSTYRRCLALGGGHECMNLFQRSVLHLLTSFMTVSVRVALHEDLYHWF